MKKISIFILSALLAMPGFAQEASLAEENIASDNNSVATVASGNTADIKTENKAEVNPDVKFPHGLQLGVGVSATSGLNGFVGYANKNFDSFWWKRFGVRLDFATAAPLKSAINSGIDSIMGDEGIEMGDGLRIKDGSIKAQHFAAMLDFYPFGKTWFLGGLRLTGGYYFGELDLRANLVGTMSDLPDAEFAFELEGTNYKYLGNEIRGTANADWNYRGPYLGTGFDLGLFAGLKIYLDAGVVFTNKSAQLGLDLPTDNLQKWNGTSWEDVNLDGIAEFERAKHDALADAQEELDKLKFYPMVKVGFMYRF